MTFKQILEAAKKNLATDIYISSGPPIFVRARGAIKALTQNDFSLSAEQIHQLIEKIYISTHQQDLKENQNTTHYSLVNECNYKVNICHKKLQPKLHLQTISTKIPSSKTMNTGFLDGFCTIKSGLALLTGMHQSGLTHTLNSLIHASNIKHEKLVGYISDQFPWQHKNLNSLIYNYNSNKGINAAVTEALKNNCDLLFLDNLNLKDLEDLNQVYSFDRPTFITLNFASMLQALKSFKVSPLYSIIKSQLKLISHQRLIFSHKIAQNIPLFEYATSSKKLFSLIENEALINSITSLSELKKQDMDKSITTDELYLAKLTRNELISSQQAAGLSNNPSELMRIIATMGQEEDTSKNLVETKTAATPSSPPINLNEEWTNIENLPIDND